MIGSASGYNRAMPTSADLRPPALRPRTHARGAVPRARAAGLPHAGPRRCTRRRDRDGDVLGEVPAALRRRLGLLRVVLRGLSGLHVAAAPGRSRRSRSRRRSLWAIFYELTGFGCGSGPMNARFNPPLGGFLHFLRPGTTKLPLLPGRARCSAASGAAGSTSRSTPRTSSSCCARWSRRRSRPRCCWPSVVLIPLLGVTDKTLFLAARAEHYWVALVCLAAALRGRALDLRLQGGLVRDLVLGRDLEAQPPLPVGHHGDDEQRAVLPEVAEEAALRRPTRTTCGPRALAAAMAHMGTLHRVLRSPSCCCSRARARCVTALDARRDVSASTASSRSTTRAACRSSGTS